MVEFNEANPKLVETSRLLRSATSLSANYQRQNPQDYDVKVLEKVSEALDILRPLRDDLIGDSHIGDPSNTLRLAEITALSPSTIRRISARRRRSLRRT